MPTTTSAVIEKALRGERLSDEESLRLVRHQDGDGLLRAAGELRDRGHGSVVTYSRKVFIPLTQLCRDVCHYCTFAQPPKPGERAYLTPDEVLAIARAGAEQGCKEALFTLGDKPERRYKVAREELAAMGYATTIEYLVDMCRLVLNETGLLPHANPGVMTRGSKIVRLRSLRELRRDKSGAGPRNDAPARVA